MKILLYLTVIITLLAITLALAVALVAVLIVTHDTRPVYAIAAGMGTCVGTVVAVACCCVGEGGEIKIKL